MIISHRKRFAFFRNPKTGSTTTNLLLRLSGGFSQDDILSECHGLSWNIPSKSLESIHLEVGDNQRELLAYIGHMTPSQAVKHGLITESQLSEYSCYAFLRDPVDRAISAYAHSFGMIAPPLFFRKILDESKKRPGVLWRKQSDYFLANRKQVVTPLYFDKFSDEVKFLMTVIGSREFKEIPKINPSIGRRMFSNDEYCSNGNLEIIHSMFGEDFQFINQGFCHAAD